jgi:spermidine synthase
MTTSPREQFSSSGDAAVVQSSASAARIASAASDTAVSSRRIVQQLPFLALVFIGGMVSLAIEVSGPRLLAPYYGTSLIIWANQIGFTLIYLSIGYWLGGRIADRHPSVRLMCTITAAAAVGTALIPTLSRPVLQLSTQGFALVLDAKNPQPVAGASVFIGSLLTVLLLFSVPTILLGMVSPFAIRLSVDRVGNTGSKAGSLYALSTVGSIVGAFLPVLVLIPAWGVRNSLYVEGCVLLLASLWGLRPRLRLILPGVQVLLLVPILLQGPLRSDQGLIYSQESLYNYIQVVHDAEGTNSLVLNEGADSVHSKYNPNRILFGPSWYADYVLTFPYFNQNFKPSEVKRLGIVGLAAGTVARQFTAVYGPIPIDGAEIDPAIVDVGKQYFGMNEPNLNIYLGDGRTFMRTSKQTYDVVVVDAFQQPYMPFHFTTKEFYEEVKAHLSPTGVVSITSGHGCTDYRLVQALVNTLSQVFPSVYTLDVPNSFSTVVVATNSPTTLATYQANLAQVPDDALISQTAHEGSQLMNTAHAERNGLVFTDDRAPVEQITDQLILSYLRCE